ncbi:hypothetical protein ACP275_06G093000 [Erythranthe tilingii]
MFGTVSEERAVKVPASEAWKIYGTLELPKIAVGALSHMISKVDVVQGDGGVGTVLEIFLHPGQGQGPTSYKEIFTVVDDEKRVKVAEVVEGGYLDMGFTLYRIRFELIEKEETECIVRATIEYEVKEEFAANASFALASIQTFVAAMEAVAIHLIQNYDNNHI